MSSSSSRPKQQKGFSKQKGKDLVWANSTPPTNLPPFLNLLDHNWYFTNERQIKKILTIKEGKITSIHILSPHNNNYA